MLKPTVTGTDTSSQYAMDGKYDTINTGTLSDCHIEMTFKPGYIGALDRVKFYAPHFVEKKNYVNNLAF